MTRLAKLFRVARRPARRARLTIQSLEDRRVPTATLYVDFGANFPSGTLSGITTGDFVSTAHGPGLYYSGESYTSTDSLSIRSFDSYEKTQMNPATGADYTATELAQVRSDIMKRIEQQYKPFNVTVAELTGPTQTVNGHSVVAAANLNDIANDLAANNGDATNHDAYVVVGFYTIAGHTDLSFGGLAPGANGTASSGDYAASVPLYTGTTFAYTGDSISHEAGHCFSLEHVYQSGNAGQFGQDEIDYPGITPTENANNFYLDELMSYNQASSLAYFSRYPTIDGANQHGDTYDTLSSTKGSPAEEFLQDPQIGPGNYEYVTGTAKNDEIVITKLNATTASVSVTAYDDAAHTTALDLPGSNETKTALTYNISLTKPLLINTGEGTDTVKIIGDLGVAVELDGQQANSGANKGDKTLDVTADTDFTLTDTELTLASGMTVTFDTGEDQYNSVRVADLTGGGSNNKFDLSGWSGQGAVDGTGGNDRLIGPDGFNTWTISNPDAGDINSDVTFTSVENLVGVGGGDDQFAFGSGGRLDGTIDGGGGTANSITGDDAGRTFTVTGTNSGSINGILPAGFTNVQNLAGGASDDSFVFAAGRVAGYVDGGGGTNTVVGDNTGHTYAVTGSGIGTVDTLIGIGFFATQSVTAGAGADTFRFDDGGALSGNIDAGDGNDLLIGDGGGRTFTLTGPNGGTVSTILGGTFANMESLQGGAGGDTLAVQAAGFLGGSFDGGLGRDTVDLSSVAGAQSPTLSGASGDGYDAVGVPLVAGGLFEIDALIGSTNATTNTLTGRNANATWAVSRTDGGQYTDASGKALDFDGFQSLTGGSGNDTLTVSVGGGLAGSFDGGPGTDTADFSAVGSQTFRVTGLGATDGYDVSNVPLVAGGLNDLESLVGSSGGNNSLTGGNADGTFDLTGADLGSYQDVAVPNAPLLAFRAIESLVGGLGNDTLVVAGPAATLAGTFDGGAGVDTADLSALSNVQQISVLALGATDGYNTTGGTNVATGSRSVGGNSRRGLHAAVSGTGLGLLNLNRLIAGKAAGATVGQGDRLTGMDVDATWLDKFGTDQSFYQVAGSTQTLLFANFEELFGGTGKDAMTVDFSAGNPVAATGLTTDGGSGSDSLTAVGQTAAHNGFLLGVKSLRVNKHVIRYKNFETLSATGGSSNDTFYAGNASLAKMVGLVSFNAGGGNDTATVSPTTLAVLHLDGGSGTNTLRVLNTGEHYIAPIPPKSVVSGTYFFSNRQQLQFIDWQVRNIGITQPQP